MFTKQKPAASKNDHDGDEGKKGGFVPFGKGKPPMKKGKFVNKGKGKPKPKPKPKAKGKLPPWVDKKS